MNVNGQVRVSTVLADLEVELPADSHWKPTDMIDFEVDVDDDEAYAALPSSYTEIDPVPLSDELDQGDVQNLAAAIRRGDRAEAELLLDRIFANDGTVTEWVERGRYGQRARQLQTPTAKAA